MYTSEMTFLALHPWLTESLQETRSITDYTDGIKIYDFQFYIFSIVKIQSFTTLDLAALKKEHFFPQLIYAYRKYIWEQIFLLLKLVIFLEIWSFCSALLLNKTPLSYIFLSTCFCSSIVHCSHSSVLIEHQKFTT